MRMKHSSRSRREAFTLIEVLIVLSIIVILVSLSAVAVLRFSRTGPALATQTNVDKSRSALMTQWNGVRSQAQNELMSSFPAYRTQAVTNAGGATSQSLVRPKYIQLRIVQAFPMSFAEALWPLNPPSFLTTTTDAYGPYVDYLNNLGVKHPNTAGNKPAWNNTPLAVQQAVCLLMILQTGPKNGGWTTDNLGTGAVATFTLGNGNTATGLADAWGRPIAFTRFYDNKPMNVALLSAGQDGLYGVYNGTLTGTSPGPGAVPLGPVPPILVDPVSAPATNDNIIGFTP